MEVGCLPPVELVLATHGETLEWLRYLPATRSYRVKVSCSEYDRTDLQKLPNVDEIVRRHNYGREAGHWLQHLVERYDSLAQWTVFLQAEPFIHAGQNVHGPCGLLRILFGQPTDFPLPWAAIGHMENQAGGIPNLDIFPVRKNILQAAWGDELPKTQPCPFMVGAQFLVQRELVLARPKAHYQRLLDLCPSTSFSIAHELEPCWRLVFAPDAPTP